MMYLTFALYIFLELIQYLVFADVILSWLQLLWIRWRPQFLASIIDPLYSWVKKIIPTSMWPIDFTPIIILMVIFFLIWLVDLFFPGSFGLYKAYMSSIF